MDKEKLAEGRRRAAEERRLAAEQQRAEEEKQREEEEKLRLDVEAIRDFERGWVHLNTFYDEISILSKKSPDGPVNKFKLKLLNETLKKM